MIWPTDSAYLVSETPVDLKQKILEAALSTHEGREQLKQMIEEAENKTAEMPTLDEAIDELLEAYMHCGLFLPNERYTKARAALHTAAQREQRQVVGEDQSFTHRTVRIFDTDCIELYQLGRIRYAIDAKDVRGILYALSRLEEK